nr:hypothetical protein [Tanacetum cinerariifolium]
MVEEPKPLKKKRHVEMDEEYARKLHAKLNKDIDWDVAIDHVKKKAKEDPTVQRYQGMSYDDICLIFEAKFNSNIEFLVKTKEQMEEEENRAIQSINETPAQKAAKRRKLNKEVEDLKRNLEIVHDEDDDVYTKATPLARKTRWTGSSLEESKDCTWSSKGYELEATGIMWCAHYNLYNYAADFVGRTKIPTLKVYPRLNAKCNETSSGRTK